MGVARAFMFLFLINIALVAIALVDCLGRDDAPRRLPRFLWAVVIIGVPLVGSVTWFLAGRPRPRRTASRPRTAAPDDDPDFLASLDRAQRREEELLRRWEAEIRATGDDTDEDADGAPPRRPGTGRAPRRDRVEPPPEDGPDPAT